jgi:hypothetical protein
LPITFTLLEHLSIRLLYDRNNFPLCWKVFSGCAHNPFKAPPLEHWPIIGEVRVMNETLIHHKVTSIWKYVFSGFLTWFRIYFEGICSSAMESGYPCHKKKPYVNDFPLCCCDHNITLWMLMMIVAKWKETFDGLLNRLAWAIVTETWGTHMEVINVKSTSNLAYKQQHSPLSGE